MYVIDFHLTQGEMDIFTLIHTSTIAQSISVYEQLLHPNQYKALTRSRNSSDIYLPFTQNDPSNASTYPRPPPRPCLLPHAPWRPTCSSGERENGFFYITSRKSSLIAARNFNLLAPLSYPKTLG